MANIKDKQGVLIATINVRGLNIAGKRAHIFQSLLNLPYQIFALQDTHITQTAIKICMKEWPGQSCLCPSPNSRSCGAAFLLKPDFNANVVNFKHDADGRVIAFNIRILKKFSQTFNY